MIGWTGPVSPSALAPGSHDVVDRFRERRWFASEAKRSFARSQILGRGADAVRVSVEGSNGLPFADCRSTAG